MRFHTGGFIAGCLLFGLGLSFGGPLLAEESANTPTPEKVEAKEPHWMEPIPIPADPELEQQIKEVREALGTIDQQIVRRKEAAEKAQEPATKTTLYEELEHLRKEHDDLEALLHDLVNEAKASEQTAVDEALARARWLERRQEYLEQKEELIRDLQP